MTGAPGMGRLPDSGGRMDGLAGMVVFRLEDRAARRSAAGWAALFVRFDIGAAVPGSDVQADGGTERCRT